MQKSNKGHELHPEHIASKIIEELDILPPHLVEKLENIFASLEETARILSEAAEKPTLDVIMTKVGDQPIRVISELRDIASLAELNDAMRQGPFKIGRNLPWQDANKLADKVRFWGATTIIVPSNTIVEEKPQKTKKKRKPFFRR